MAVRADVAVDWTGSPRIATVASPSASITIQDLYDTLATEQQQVWNMTEPVLVKASGKEDLGSGLAVGVTLELQNTRLAFAARTGPTYVQCTVAQGNLVAVDATGAAMNPIEPTAFTQVVTEKSTSASIAASDPGAIADAVLDEAMTDHEASGSVGEALRNILSAGVGKIVAGGGDPPTTFTYYAMDNTTVLFTLTVGATERTRT